MSDIILQMSDFIFHMSVIKLHMSDIILHMSDIILHMSNIKLFVMVVLHWTQALSCDKAIRVPQDILCSPKLKGEAYSCHFVRLPSL